MASSEPTQTQRNDAPLAIHTSGSSSSLLTSVHGRQPDFRESKPPSTPSPVTVASVTPPQDNQEVRMEVEPHVPLVGRKHVTLNLENLEEHSGSRCHFFIYHAFWFYEWILVLVCVILVVILEQIEPHTSYIPARDPTIAYPLVPNTVSSTVLAILSVLLPAVFIAGIHVSDYARHRDPTSKTLVLFRMHTILRLFILCIATDLLLTSAIKRYVGRPRPNFIAMAGYSLNPAGEPQYSAPTIDVWEAKMSFVSGHASLSMAGLLYLSQYFAERFRHASTRAIEFVCWWPVILALWIGCTRILDYWHGTTDVIAGTILGASIARFFYPHTYPSIPSFYPERGRVRSDKAKAIQAIAAGDADVNFPVPLPNDRNSGSQKKET